MSRKLQILVAAESVADAENVGSILRKEFADVALSTDPARAVADFEAARPTVWVTQASLESATL